MDATDLYEYSNRFTKTGVQDLLNFERTHLSQIEMLTTDDTYGGVHLEY